jgi:hypothetical protein
MRMLKQALGVLGALVLLAVIVAFVAPNRARAVAATLVQIVPGNTTHVGQNQGALVSLYCEYGYEYCVPVTPEGQYSSSTPAYVVPSGKTLIVTDWEWWGVDYEGAQAGTLSADTLYNTSGGGFATSFVIADKNGRSYTHEHYATGIRVGSGVTIYDNVAFFEYGTAWIQGYLVPND